MNKIFLFLFVVTFILVNKAGAEQYAPVDGKTLVFIGQDIENIESYVNAAGVIPGGFMEYTKIELMDGITRPSEYVVYSHAQYLVDKYPNTTIQMGLSLLNELDNTINGKYDSNIDFFSDWAKNVNRPIYLRIGYEFDGPHNYYDPDKYKLAYRHIVDRLKANGVDNISYVWHSWANYPYEGYEVIKWYPGDEYVDWFAISYYDNPLYFKEKFANLAKQYGKPLMIAEATPVRIGTLKGKISWNLWFRDFFAFIEKKDVKALSYATADWEKVPFCYGWGWGNSRLEDNEYIFQKWLEELAKPRYLQSSDTLFIEIGYGEKTGADPENE